MLIAIPDLLAPPALARVRALVDDAEWVDGRATAGEQSGSVKRNAQLPESSPAAREAGEVVLAALAGSPLFLSAALPLRIFPPLFNRYGPGSSFGLHIDNAVRPVPGSPVRVRTDLSATVFLSNPDEYDGGELEIEDAYGAQSVKLPAGHMVLYPSKSLHRVTEVTRGARIASFFWIQSMVRDDGERALLFDLDQSIQEFAVENGVAHAHAVRLSGVYHNLVRRWADS